MTYLLRGLSQVQKDKPAYQGQFGARGWWSEVIKRTAIGAGADPRAVQASLDEIVPRLMDRFSSSEGYKLFDDALPILRQLQELNIRTALISNSDSRMRLVLADLGISPFLRPVVLSEEEGIEKPNAEIFRRAFKQALDNSSHFDQAVHVGDELQCDYYGAQAAGMQAVLIRRAGPDGIQEHKEADEDLSSVRVISSLHDVVDWIYGQHLLLGVMGAGLVLQEDL
ncbi:HAD hydrolase subfamily IA REG-2-like protein [Boletus reticuloceps]|uniref:HAD hydrolase subfamily IA REG-2-like protein n=1 Tax=Boletus reticuloceps TaxID=495285 RepID=A0A8I2YNL8_9AGAM|nr:HAD hydrolase subfamily IA REG-2-like protein [Boletus reticuloceps]